METDEKVKLINCDTSASALSFCRQAFLDVKLSPKLCLNSQTQSKRLRGEKGYDKWVSGGQVGLGAWASQSSENDG
jgi:hypothetical protein